MMITTVNTKRGNVIEIDESKRPVEYLAELNNAKPKFITGEITYDELVVFAERYIESVRLWGKRNKKRVPFLSVAKLLR